MSSTSPAVGRALDVLLHLASRPGPVQGSALIRDIGMPRSSAYHLLEVLIERGFVVHLPDQRAYALGFSAFEVGSAYLRHEPLEHIARPILKRLVAAVGETAHLGILYGAESVYLLKEQPQTAGVPVTLVTDVGVRLPAHLTANGRSILAHLSAAQVRALFPSSASFIHRTERGPNSLAELRRILQTERAQGWAEEAGMITEGLQSVAACAFDHAGRPVAAFSATRREDRPNTASAHLGRRRSRGGAAADPGVVRTRTRRLVLIPASRRRNVRFAPIHTLLCLFAREVIMYHLVHDY